MSKITQFKDGDDGRTARTPARRRAKSVETISPKDIPFPVGISFPERIMFLKRDTLGRYGTGSLSDLEKIAHEYEIPLEYLCKCGKLVMKCSDCRFGWNERGFAGAYGDLGCVLHGYP